MPKRAIASVLVLLLTLTGCHVRKVQQFPVASVSQPEKEQIVGITTTKGQDVSFDLPGASIAAGILHGTVKKVAYDLPLDQVQRYWVERNELSTGRTVGLVAGVAAGIIITAVIAAAILNKGTSVATTPKSTTASCPFVYSWDGTRYIFDAEPYGGAIARGLEKDDYSELNQLREQEGVYKLRMTNEVDETQMTNLSELWVIDHPAGTRVLPDMRGNLHTIASPQQPLSASDPEGHDLLPWLRATDRVIWEPSAIPDATGNLASDITMTFPKPAHAKEAKLIVNAATGLWGAYMIKKMVGLRGREMGRFYTAVNHSASARKQLADWELREQLYQLKVSVEEPTGWQVRGVIPGTGPYMSKDRILPLDVSHVVGDTVRIRIQPPAGFWALNSFNIDYSQDRPITTQKLQPTSAQDLQGKSVLAQLTAVDSRYYAQPNVGDTADITFIAPPTRPGTERAVILHTRGYYKLHLNATGDPDTKTLEAFEKVPGSAARFAATQFGQWQLASAQHAP